MSVFTSFLIMATSLLTLVLNGQEQQPPEEGGHVGRARRQPPLSLKSTRERHCDSSAATRQRGRRRRQEGTPSLPRIALSLSLSLSPTFTYLSDDPTTLAELKKRRNSKQDRSLDTSDKSGQDSPNFIASPETRRQELTESEKELAVSLLPREY